MTVPPEGRRAHRGTPLLKWMYVIDDRPARFVLVREGLFRPVPRKNVVVRAALVRA